MADLDWKAARQWSRDITGETRRSEQWMPIGDLARCHLAALDLLREARTMIDDLSGWVRVSSDEEHKARVALLARIREAIDG